MTVGLSAQQRRSTRIAGLGSARPHRTVPGAALVDRFGKSAEWLRQRTGISELRRLGEGDSLVELGVRAARRALVDADVGVPDVLVVASCSWAAPAGPLSHLIAAEVAPRAVAYDLNAACAGFCYALSAASTLVEMSAAEHVLVIGAEQMSALVDPADLGTSILFADGAGAAVVSAAEGPAGIGAPAWTSDGAAADVLRVPDGATTLRMDGPAVFRWAVDEVHKVAAEAIARAGLRPDDIEVFVPHQANLRIVEAIARKLGLDNAITATDVVDSGNTSAASIPMALARLRRREPATHGRLALLTGFGAGLTIAAQVVRLP